jgi:cytochrome c oxidase subunit IV
MSTHTEHAVDPKKEASAHIVTLVTLLILTGITVGASYIHFGSGSINIVIALTIATIKATIVALFFMHLLHDKPVNAVIAVAGFVFLGIFLLFDFLDVGSRTNPQPTNLHAPPAATAPATAGAPETAGAPATATPAAATPAPAPDERKE